MKISTIISSAIVAATLAVPCSTKAAPFFDTSAPDETFGLGARIGFNMSNVSAGGNRIASNNNSWGTGFDAGVVANINIRDFLTIQPGFFYQSRSSKYTLMRGYGADQDVEVGKNLHYAFNIPVMAVFHFNISDDVRWNAECGPYISLGLGKSDKGIHLLPLPEETYNRGYFDKHKRTLWGMKFGTGITIKDHYYVGIHYMAGIGNVWKEEGINGHAKAWTFTVGYDF